MKSREDREAGQEARHKNGGKTTILRKSSQPEESRAAQAEDRSEPAAYIFVDVPNLVGPGAFGGEKQGTISPYRLNWAALMGLLAHYNGRHLMVKKAIAYTFLPAKYSREEEWLVNRRLGQAGFSVVCRQDKKDVDTEIVFDLVNPATIDMSRGKIWLILVAGDKDYVRSVREFKDRAQKNGVELKVILVAWKNGHLAASLKEEAYDVLYVDDILDVIDYVGFKVLQNPKTM